MRRAEAEPAGTWIANGIIGMSIEHKVSGDLQGKEKKKRKEKKYFGKCSHRSLLGCIPPSALIKELSGGDDDDDDHGGKIYFHGLRPR
jgi:hypothetical protein